MNSRYDFGGNTLEPQAGKFLMSRRLPQSPGCWAWFSQERRIQRTIQDIRSAFFPAQIQKSFLYSQTTLHEQVYTSIPRLESHFFSHLGVWKLAG